MNKWSGAMFLPALVGVNAYALLAFDAGWRGSWLNTIDAVTGATVLTTPVVAAFAAHLALGQHGIADVTEATPRGRLVPLRCAGQAWAWSALVYAAAAMAAAGVTAVLPHGGAAQWWAVSIGLLVLGAGALAGALAVQLWPHRMMVILIGPLVFLIGAFGKYPYADLLRQGPMTGSGAGLEYDPRVWLLQAAALLGLIGVLGAVGVILHPQRRRSLRPVPVIVMVAATILLMGAGTARGRGDDADRFRHSAERPTACAGIRPQVCLAPSNGRFLEPFAQRLDEAAAILQATGAVVPDRYEELLPGYHPGVEVGMITSFGDDRRPLVEVAATQLTNAAGCPAWTDPAGPPPDAAFEAQHAITAWILTSSGHRASTWSREEARWLAQADTGATRQWVRESFGQLRRCDLAAIRLPWPAAASPR